MANRYVRSLFWLVGCGSFGYLLYVACTPSEADISARKDKLPGVENSKIESLKKREQIIFALQAAALSDKPLYRLKKEDIEKEIKSK